jgi:hypothetical protein
MDETPRLIEHHTETTILATGISHTRCPTLAKRLTSDRYASTYLFKKKLGVDLKNYKATQIPRKREGKKRIIGAKLEIFYVHTPLGDG